MEDIDEIRRQNIKRLEKQFGGPSALAKLVFMSDSQYINLRDGAKESKTGKRRGMRKETAWKFDIACHKPPGWLDKDHPELDIEESQQVAERTISKERKSPTVTKFDGKREHPAIEQVVCLMKEMQDPGKWMLLERARMLADEWKEAPKANNAKS